MNSSPNRPASPIPWPLCGAAVIWLSLSSCVSYDPEFVRQSKQIQDINYPASTIVGEWMQVGSDNEVFVTEERVYSLFRADGTGLRRMTSIVPSIYSQYRDVMIIEDMAKPYEQEWNFTWSYKGNNRWEIVYDHPSRIRTVSMPGWKKKRENPMPYGEMEPSQVRYHNDRIFFMGAHSTAVSMRNLILAKAQVDSIRRIYLPRLKFVLDLKRAEVNRVRSDPNLQHLLNY